MHESICFDRRYDEQASRIGTLRAAIMRFVREQEHRVQGLDATLASIRSFLRQRLVATGVRSAHFAHAFLDKSCDRWSLCG
jgi:hypothetical protein